MSKKFIGSIICMLVITTILPITAIAGDENDPEIVDDVGDTPLSLLDIEAAWFYEQTDEPDYLFVAMKITYLTENYNAVFSIRWSHDGEHYAAGVNTFNFRETVFRSGLPKQANYWQWKHMPECDGFFDIENGVMTWKIPKSTIGDPQPGDVLTNTRANAVPGFPLSFLYFVLHLDYRDFAPNNIGEYGRDYIIQY
jgi:hypothetical protein